jgi:hypothetical protein
LNSKSIGKMQKEYKTSTNIQKTKGKNKDILKSEIWLANYLPRSIPLTLKNLTTHFPGCVHALQ